MQFGKSCTNNDIGNNIITYTQIIIDDDMLLVDDELQVLELCGTRYLFQKLYGDDIYREFCINFAFGTAF